MSKSTPKSRKIEEEQRKFNKEWTYDYFFVQHLGKNHCLICNQNVSSTKKSNIKRHFETNHESYKLLVGDARVEKIAQLKSALTKRVSMFHNYITEAERSTKASYKVAQLIAKWKKPFTDGEFVKECLMEVVECVFPEKIKKISDICLSARTITRRIEEISEDVKMKQINLCKVVHNLLRLNYISQSKFKSFFYYLNR